jgi:hypothetical protein
MRLQKSQFYMSPRWKSRRLARRERRGVG